MNSFEKIRKKKFCQLMIAYGLVTFLGVICSIVIKEEIEKRSYYIPKEDVNVEYGVPGQVELKELQPKENIRLGISNSVYVEEEKLYVYLTNFKENEFAMNAFLYDEEKNIYAESGMIWQEHYLPYLQLDKELLSGKEYYINIAFYNRNDMTSEGSIWIRVGEPVVKK